MYFPEQVEANAADPILALVADAARGRPSSRSPTATGSASTSTCRVSGRRCSLPSDAAARALLRPPIGAWRGGLDDEAWLQAMLDVEAALAARGGDAGLVPPADGRRPSPRAAAPTASTWPTLGARAAAAGNPVIPLVADLRRRGADGRRGGRPRRRHEPGRHRHLADARSPAALIPPGRRRLARAASRRGRRWPSATGTTSSPGRRTLLPARGADHVRADRGDLAGRPGRRQGRARRAVAAERLAVQLGGARGDAGAPRRPRRRGDGAPRRPAGAGRTRAAVGTRPRGGSSSWPARWSWSPARLGEVATDVVGLMQTEVDEVREGRTRPRRLVGHAAQAQPGPRPRSSSRPRTRWSAWPPSCSAPSSRSTSGPPAPGTPSGTRCGRALLLTAGAAARVADLLEGLDVDAARMRTNLDRTGGLVMTEAVVTVAGRRRRRPGRGSGDGRDRVRCARSTARPGPWPTCWPSTPSCAARSARTALRRTLDPRRHLGATDAFIDRALSTARGATTP